MNIRNPVVDAVARAVGRMRPDRSEVAIVVGLEGALERGVAAVAVAGTAVAVAAGAGLRVGDKPPRRRREGPIREEQTPAGWYWGCENSSCLSTACDSGRFHWYCPMVVDGCDLC